MPSQKIPMKTAQNNPNFQGVQDVEPQEVLEQKNNLILVDVRRPDELQSELSHIPGVTHVVLDELAFRFAEIPTDKTLVFICRSGQRSASATEFAQSQGRDHVYNMAGGMLRWNELHFPTQDKPGK